MKTLKNESMAFYRSNSVQLSCLVIGWILALIIGYICCQDKKLFYTVLPIATIFSVISFIVELKRFFTPVLIVSPQKIQFGFHSTPIFWEQIKIIYYEKCDFVLEQLVCETTEGAIHKLNLFRISNKDRQCLFKIFEKHGFKISNT